MVRRGDVAAIPVEFHEPVHLQVERIKKGGNFLPEARPYPRFRGDLMSICR